jgi:hypothetical protein
LTVKLLLVPFWAPPVVRVAVIVKLPVFEIVTACELSTPAVKAAVVPEPAESVPVEVMSTVPVKPGDGVRVRVAGGDPEVEARAGRLRRRSRRRRALRRGSCASAPGLTVKLLLVRSGRRRSCGWR